MATNYRNAVRGPSQRQLRVGELIRRVLSEILARDEIHDPDLNRISITVGEVCVSPDLRAATAYVLPLGGKDREDALALLVRNGGELRRAVSKSTKLKYSPKLRFAIDDRFDRMDETRDLLARDTVRADLDRSGGAT